MDRGMSTVPRVTTGLPALFAPSRRNLRMGYNRADLVHSHVIRSRDLVQNTSLRRGKACRRRNDGADTPSYGQDSLDW